MLAVSLDVCRSRNHEFHVKQVICRAHHRHEFIERLDRTQIVLFPASPAREQEILFRFHRRRQESFRFVIQHRAIENRDFLIQKLREEGLDRSTAMFAHRNAFGATVSNAGRQIAVLGRIEILFPTVAVTHKRFELLSKLFRKANALPAVLHFKSAHAMPREHKTLHLNLPFAFERIKRRVERINRIFVDNLLRRLFGNVKERNAALFACFKNIRRQVFAAIVNATELCATLHKRPENHFAIAAATVKLCTVNRLHSHEIKKQIHKTPPRKACPGFPKASRGMAFSCTAKRAILQTRKSG